MTVGRLLLASLLPGLLLGLGACRDKGTEPAPVAAQGASTPDEALCPHGVLATICPKCHPAMAAVFRAKGDWCKEHELPESVCPICHPERGGKPSRGVVNDGSPADGTLVKLKNGTIAEQAGFRTAKAVLRLGGGGVAATATVVYDAARVARINARAPGVVRSLLVDIGSPAELGATLAVVESPEVGADRSRLVAARSRIAIAEELVKREEDLARQRLTTRTDVLAAQRELQAAQAEQASLASSLAIIGATKGKRGGYAVTMPLGGVVVRRNVSLGQLVHTEDVLFEVVDTSVMWAEIDIPERSLPEVSPGQVAVLRFDALPGREFRGPVAFVSPEIDVRSRTARARVRLDNPDGLLRANLYGQARLLVAGREAVMVPYQAVQRAKAVQLVFVQQAPDRYEARRVELGPSDGDAIEVTRGLKPGEVVVTEGSFLLKTETLKDSIGAGCCAAD